MKIAAITALAALLGTDFTLGMPPRNDECVNATVIPAAFSSPYVSVISNASLATFNALDPASACFYRDDPTVWFRWTPSTSGRFDFFVDSGAAYIYPSLAIFAGNCGSLAEVACYGTNGFFRFTARAGLTYAIQVNYYSNYFPIGNVTLTVKSVPPPPPNDECVNATVIPAAFSSPYVNVVANASFADANGLDPSSRCGGGEANVWFKWTPSSSGRFDFVSSELHRNAGGRSIVAVYTGNCGSLAEVACADSYDDFLRFTVRAGVSYWIEVGFSLSSLLGNLTSTVRSIPPPPPNDECVNATVIPSAAVHYTNFVNTSLATNNPADVELSCYDSNDSPGNGNTVWYKWTAARSGKLVVSTVGSTALDGSPLETVLNIVTGTCGAIVRGACLDSYSDEELSFLVTAGVTYYIEVGEYKNGRGGGNVFLTFDFDSSYLSLIDADTDRPLDLLREVVDYSTPSASSLNIRSIFSSDLPPIDSVRLTFNNPARSVCEENDPYTVFGDSGRDYFGATIPLGSHLVTATPFARTGCQGAAGKNVSQAFRVYGCTEYIRVYDGNTNAYFTPLYDGSTVLNPPCGVNIQASVICGFPIKRVALELRRNTAAGAIVASRVEVGEPYYLFGDNGAGDVYSGTIAAGNYTIRATINGIQHPPRTFTFGRCA